MSNVLYKSRKESTMARFVLKSDNDVDELVSNAQAQATKLKTEYDVNMFKGRCFFVTLLDSKHELFPAQMETLKLHLVKNIAYYFLKNGQKFDKYRRSSMK